MAKAIKKAGRFYIGTSGLALPFNKTSFPEAYKEKSRLSFYSTLLNSIEINSSFYKLPRPATLARWADETGDDFLFTIKLSKTITHSKGLQFQNADIQAFFAVAKQLNHKAGCLLIQFPASVKPKAHAQVNKLLKEVIAAKKKQAWHVCVEFRDKEWYTPKTMQMLDALQCSLVLHDMPKSKIVVVNKKSPVIYLRFHGINGDYRGGYKNDLLLHYATLIKRWLKKGKDVYGYFNNTMGDAYNNAQYLLKAVDEGFEPVV